MAEKPIFTFPDSSEFVQRHKSATREEFAEHQVKVESFNLRKHKFCAWVITAPSPSQPWLSHILRVNLNADIVPGIGQSCRMRLVDSDGGTSAWCSCRRGAEVIALNHESWNNLIELLVTIPDHVLAEFKDCLCPILDHSTTSRTLRKDNDKSIQVQLMLDVSKATMVAELTALDRLTAGNASIAGRYAFRYLMNFQKPRNVVDLFESFPHLADLDEIPDDRLREGLKKVVDDFDEDQTRAWLGVSCLPERICFVPGGPGAGKTWWTLTMAVLAQSGKQRCTALYLVDINKPVDDAADRMHAMYRQLRLEKSVVRVTGWPLADTSSMNGRSDSLRDADFTEGFLRARESLRLSNGLKAPTLDEKAWDYYSTQPEKYRAATSALKKVLAAADSGNWQTDMDLLRRTLTPLYYDTLCQADFIATTPVTAPRLSNIIKPELVIFDECAHARELSTMISLAHFDPRAWFFVGDHRQTEPFVEARHGKYQLQLKVSTMERADKCNAITNQLLINHRAYGGLERLASDLFYNGAMRSENTNDELFPLSVRSRLQWLKSLTAGKPNSGKLAVSRLLVIRRSVNEVMKVGTSCWNPEHQETVLKYVDSLLADRDFLQVHGESPGTIMILSPYKEAINRYQGAINRLPTKDMKRRVQVRTVDTAQGQEADVVFLDMVNDHQTPHINNAKRLCVALTRARQAEIILMHPNMALSPSDVWGTIKKKCLSGEEGAVLYIGKASSPTASGGW